MTTRKAVEEAALVPTRKAGHMTADTPAMREWAEELVSRARSEGVDLTGEDGLLTAMVRQVLQTGLEVEMSEPEVNGDPPPLFLLQAIRIDAGEGAHKCRLAVIDVPCGSDDNIFHGISYLQVCGTRHTPVSAGEWVSEAWLRISLRDTCTGAKCVSGPAA